MGKLLSPNKAFKRFNEDLWGTIRLESKVNNLGLLFIKEKGDNLQQSSSSFTFNIVDQPYARQRKRLSKYGFYLLERKKICMFYGGVPLKQYRFLCRKSSRKNSLFKNFNLNIAYGLESSLCFSLYRVGFVATMGAAHDAVRSGKVMVNREVITQPFHKVMPGEVVEILPMFKEDFFNCFMKRLEKDSIFQCSLEYIYINHANMSYSFLKEEFKTAKLFYPFKFNSESFFSAEYKAKY